MTPRAALVELLMRLFTPAGLRSFLLRFDGGPELRASLPGEEAALIVLVTATVEALEHRALITPAFFGELVYRRPHQQQAIAAVAVLWDSEGPQRVLDRELIALGQRFFDAAGRVLEMIDDVAFRARYPVYVSQNSPPTVDDAVALRALLGENRRGYFLHRGVLPLDVQDLLNQMRVKGNPVAPIDAETMQTALTEGSARATVAGRDQTYFRQQNLFDMTNALTDRQFFFGRETLLTELGSGLSLGDAVLLTGLRKSGKTSVLRVLRYHLPEHPWCAVDLQQFQPERDADWPLRVFSAIIDAFDAWGRVRCQDWPESPSDVAGGEDFLRALALRRQWQLARGRQERLVLVLDELERVFPTANKPQRADSYVFLTGVLRAALQADGDRSLSLIVADLRPTANQLNILPGGETNPLFEFFKHVPLPLLTMAETRAMLRGIGAMMGVVSIDEGFTEALYRFSGGHPSLARQLAAAAYDVRTRPEELQLVDFHAGLEKLEAQYAVGHFFEQNLWLPLRPEEQALIVSIATPARGTWAQRLAAMVGLSSERPADPRVRASLRSQGLLSDDQIVIAGFEEWLRTARPMLQAASK